eukprot:TRINITY_DN6425_c0_g2_i1.p1 TRINITY_DN6425_c0_g2~~TRINITY_DN6425_c0_g2_i1.p1  ORF type:complete len:430 (+),score=75.83 TRINITY_DN6425_c0_g2_i1:177-1466(+)
MPAAQEVVFAGSNVPFDYFHLIRTNLQSEKDSNQLLGIVGFNSWLSSATPSEMINLLRFIKSLLPSIINICRNKSLATLRIEAMKCLSQLLEFPEIAKDISNVEFISVFAGAVKNVDGMTAVTTSALNNLAKIAGQSVQLRDVVLNQKIIKSAYFHNIKESNQELLGATLNCFHALIKGRPRPDFRLIIEMLPFINDQLDKKVYLRHKEDTLFIIERLSECRADSIFELGFAKRLVQMLERQEEYLICAALKALGNLIDENPETCNRIFEENMMLVPLIGKHLESKEEKILLRCTELLRRIQTPFTLRRIAISEKIISNLLAVLVRGGSAVKKELFTFLLNLNQEIQPLQANSLFGDLFVSFLWDMVGHCQQDFSRLARTWLEKVNASKDTSPASRRLWNTLNNVGLLTPQNLVAVPTNPLLVDLSEDA